VIKQTTSIGSSQFVKSAEFIQIVPRRSQSCGVSDYASRLAIAINDLHAVSSRVRNFSIREQPLLANFPIYSQAPHSLALLLHYSGYGYAKRGAPFWLLRAMRHFRCEHPSVPWMTMFHEVAASGPINTSAFWMRPKSKF
jgi:hypothetical protein